MSMKKIITLVCIGAFVFLTAFQSTTNMDDVIGALRSGNASQMAKYLDDNIEIALPSKSDTYSRSQAVVILQDVFQNKVLSAMRFGFGGHAEQKS